MTVLFIGYTAYYFIRNNENIYLSLAENDRTIYMNVGESSEVPIVWEKPYSSTKVYENVDISNPDVVDFEPVYGTAIALLGCLYEFINNYYADDMNIVQAKAITGLADVGIPQKYVDYLLNELSNLKEKGRC